MPNFVRISFQIKTFSIYNSKTEGLSLRIYTQIGGHVEIASACHADHVCIYFIGSPTFLMGFTNFVANCLGYNESYKHFSYIFYFNAPVG